MAEYKDRMKNLVETAIEENWELDHILEGLGQINLSDAVDHSEYDKLRKENEQLKEMLGDLHLVNINLARANEQLLAEHEKLAKLHSDIIQAINEISKLPTWGGNLDATPKEVVEIIERNIGEGNYGRVYRQR